MRVIAAFVLMAALTGCGSSSRSSTSAGSQAATGTGTELTSLGVPVRESRDTRKGACDGRGAHAETQGGWDQCVCLERR